MEEGSKASSAFGLSILLGWPAALYACGNAMIPEITADGVSVYRLASSVNGAAWIAVLAVAILFLGRFTVALRSLHKRGARNGWIFLRCVMGFFLGASVLAGPQFYLSWVGWFGEPAFLPGIGFFAFGQQLGQFLCLVLLQLVVVAMLLAVILEILVWICAAMDRSERRTLLMMSSSGLFVAAVWGYFMVTDFSVYLAKVPGGTLQNYLTLPVTTERSSKGE